MHFNKRNRKRRRFQDITAEDFTLSRFGRIYTCSYWRDDGKRTTLTRARWVWLTVNGAIPEGASVRHANGDRTDDRPENLTLAWNGTKMEGKCARCGHAFTYYRQTGRDGRKYCSPECYWYSRRKDDGATVYGLSKREYLAYRWVL